MQVIVGAFKNVTQEQVRAAASSPFVTWDASIVAKGSSSGTGAVDTMMKKDLAAIVRAYERLIAKRGYGEFPPGKYEIHVRESMFARTPIITVAVEVK